MGRCPTIALAILAAAFVAPTAASAGDSSPPLTAPSQKQPRRRGAAPATHPTAATHAAQTAATIPLSALSKKERELRAEQSADARVAASAREHVERARRQRAAARARWERSLRRRIGKAPGKVINVFNGWTHENLVVDARPERSTRTSHTSLSGPLDVENVNHFLRCRFTNKVTDMDAVLLPTAIEAARHFGSDRIVVISGYRSPKYNLMLRKKGREVSRKSQHKRGKALDFRIDGVPASRVRDWARGLRLGGVGYYDTSGFVHIDTAHVRYWTGR